MTELLILALAAGLVLGAIFFGGLWWTVRKGVSSKYPALWFSRKHAAADGHCSAWLLFCRARRLAAARGMSPGIYHRAILCDAADPHDSRTFPFHSEGGQSCALAQTS